MAEQSPKKLTADVPLDPAIRRLREYVAAAIALIVILGTIVMMIIALGYVNSPDVDPADKFARVKDLLLFVNPILGVVIGYYLNKTTSEARAETAETTATSAMASAQDAAQARNQAEAETKEAKSETKEAKAALKEIGEAAEKMIEQTSEPAVGLLGDEGAAPVQGARLELQMALKRAKPLME
jgi:hypothetical protein